MGHVWCCDKVAFQWLISWRFTLQNTCLIQILQNYNPKTDQVSFNRVQSSNQCGSWGHFLLFFRAAFLPELFHYISCRSNALLLQWWVPQSDPGFRSVCEFLRSACVCYLQGTLSTKLHVCSFCPQRGRQSCAPVHFFTVLQPHLAKRCSFSMMDSEGRKNEADTENCRNDKGTGHVKRIIPDKKKVLFVVPHSK